jgi:hypothetical protein
VVVVVEKEMGIKACRTMQGSLRGGTEETSEKRVIRMGGTS